VLSGRVLNVRPPKFAIARKVLKDVISTVPNTRMSVSTFGRDHGWFDPPEVLAKMSPACEYAYPTFDETKLDRNGLKRAVNAVRFRNYERSIGEGLFGLGGYFSSQKMDNKWENWFKQPLNPGYFGWPGCCNGGTYDSPYTGASGRYWGVDAREWVKPPYSDPSTGAYLPGQPWEDNFPGGSRSVCSGSQANAVIVVSGGTPYSDNTVPITKMMNLLVSAGTRHDDGSLLRFDPSNPDTNPDVGGVNYCDRFGTTKEACDYTDYNWPAGHGVGNKNFMDDVAFFLSHMDLRDDMPGKQTVRTFVVGYGDSSPMLKSIAMAGKGSFFRADKPGELRDVILFALGQSRANACTAP
jgi:type IV pilus assembly protein PilY1